MLITRSERAFALAEALALQPSESGPTSATVLYLGLGHICITCCVQPAHHLALVPPLLNKPTVPIRPERVTCSFLESNVSKAKNLPSTKPCLSTKSQPISLHRPDKRRAPVSKMRHLLRHIHNHSNSVESYPEDHLIPKCHPFPRCPSNLPFPLSLTLPLLSPHLFTYNSANALTT